MLKQMQAAGMGGAGGAGGFEGGDDEGAEEDSDDEGVSTRFSLSNIPLTHH